MELIKDTCYLARESILEHDQRWTNCDRWVMVWKVTSLAPYVVYVQSVGICIISRFDSKWTLLFILRNSNKFYTLLVLYWQELNVMLNKIVRSVWHRLQVCRHGHLIIADCRPCCWENILQTNGEIIKCYIQCVMILKVSLVAHIKVMTQFNKVHYCFR